MRSLNREAIVGSSNKDHFDAKIVFDCAWNVLLRLGPSCARPELCLMERRNDMAPFAGGMFFNLLADNADETQAGQSMPACPEVISLGDHPGGDRGFGVVDPAGVVVCCQHPINSALAFEQFIAAIALVSVSSLPMRGLWVRTTVRSLHHVTKEVHCGCVTGHRRRCSCRVRGRCAHRSYAIRSLCR